MLRLKKKKKKTLWFCQLSLVLILKTKLIGSQLYLFFIPRLMRAETRKENGEDFSRLA
jgi:hypothetical protein